MMLKMRKIYCFYGVLQFFVILQFSHTLHQNLKYYETLHVRHLEHNIVKRGTQHGSHPYNKINQVEFYAHGRHFRLILTPRKEVIHSKFKAYEVNADGEEKSVHLDHESFYHGRVFGELDSHAQVHIDEGVITGSITISDETYHIEPSWRHLSHLGNDSMIIYKASDVKLSWEHVENGEGHTHGVPKTCGYIKEVVDDGDDDQDQGEDFEEVEITLEEDTDYNNESKSSDKLSRTKRQAETYEYTPTKTRCPLLLVADYRFYQEMGASSTKTTINYLISLIDRVHKIYNDTLWQDRLEQDGFKGMGFVIKKIVVHSEPTRVRGGDTHYNMIREKWDVRTLLEVFSREYSHKDFCLAHLFTDLKFEGGILGLAYVGSPRRNSVGGICTPEYFKNGYTLYLNSGLSSSRNHYGQRVITREADLVTAHEFGHNWGSEHDPDVTECSPSASQGGSYLMYTYSVSGYDVNNKRFSPCSLRSIKKVLQAKSGRCFSEPEESFCGNLRVEGDEECDAGLLGTEDNDACCDKNCKLRRNQGAVCSDKNSPCCQNCLFMRLGTKCRDAQYATCEQESRCTGASSECPRSPPMKNGTACLERGQCRLGKCVPYCETQGLQSCMCDIIGDACKRCCRMNLNETCFPIDPPDLLPDGTPCIQGFHLSHPESKIGQLLKVKVHALRRNVNKLGRNVNRLEQNEGCSLQIRIRGLSDNRTTLRLDTKESYSLKIHQYKSSSIQVIIKGQSYFGVRNGLETLSQLIVFNELTNQFQVASNVSILDAPMYPYRGILLDTSRNFISKATILRTIEAMGMSKLNSFHWHLSDSQSFPYISRTWPNMSRYGAYSPKKTYSSEDIKEIVDFGIHHGVRVVPELDAPGHVGEGWQWAGEDTLSCFRAQPWTKFCQEPPCGQLNPVSDKVYVLLDGLYQDLLEDFRPEIFHMGGDEVKTSCWASSESIRTWMTNQDWSLDDAGFMKLWMYFQQLAFKKLNSGEKKIKKAVLWTSSLTDEEYLKFLDPKKYIIQIWTDIYDSTIRRLLENDFQVIFSNYDALYLDCGVEAWIGEGSNWCSPYKGWKKIYNNSPLNIARHHGVENKTHLILGGEAALWTEQTDSVSVDPRLWPRSAALAERLWAEPETSWRNFEQRMLFHRERLVKRGIRADSLEPEWCRINQGLC